MTMTGAGRLFRSDTNRGNTLAVFYRFSVIQLLKKFLQKLSTIHAGEHLSNYPLLHVFGGLVSLGGDCIDLVYKEDTGGRGLQEETANTGQTAGRASHHTFSLQSESFFFLTFSIFKITEKLKRVASLELCSNADHLFWKKNTS